MFLFSLCIAILVPLFLIFGFAGMDIVLHQKTNVAISLLGVAASISTLDKFFIKKISLIRTEPQLIKKLKTDLSHFSLTLILTLIVISVIICLNPYIKTEFALIAVFACLIPLSLSMLLIPSTLIIFLANYSQKMQKNLLNIPQKSCINVTMIN